MCWQTDANDAYDAYESLPDWARATLDAHASDYRPHIYSLDQFERAQTHDASAAITAG